MDDHDHDDEVMRLAGCTHLEEMHDLCDFLLARGSLDVDAQAHVEQVQERAFELEELLDEIEDRTLSVSVEEAAGQLDTLALFFDQHAMKMARRARTMKRTLAQDPYFVQLRHDQAQGEDARKLARLEVEAGHVCNKCGARMVIRTGAESGDHFWGCARFPHCRSSFRLSREERQQL